MPSGTVLISKRRAARQVIQVLRNRGIVAIPFDQNATSRWGVFADFFGVPASTHPGLARLHELSGSPVYPVFLVRQGGSPRHQIVIRPLVIVGIDATATRTAAALVVIVIVVIDRRDGLRPVQVKPEVRRRPCERDGVEQREDMAIE